MQPKHFAASGEVRVLNKITRGYERECLRVDAAGRLAHLAPPAGPGRQADATLDHHDYAEALPGVHHAALAGPGLPPAVPARAAPFQRTRLGEELMWAGSMPCQVGTDADIPIADYGSLHAARFKSVYREGLGLRYGRQMQTIAGAHYNWSLPEAFWPILQALCPRPRLTPTSSASATSV